MAAKNAELRVSTGVTFSGTDQLVYLKSHWNLLDGIPLSFTPIGHTHGNISDDGKIGSTENLAVITTTGGLLTTQSRSGIDTRSSFPPSAHTHSYAAEGGTSFSGKYPVVVRVSENSIYSDADLQFEGSTSKLYVTGGIDVGGYAAVLTNDSRLSDSRPASDVYAWAKASVKPAYTYSDVGASAAGHTHAYAPTSHASSATTYGLGTTANYGHVKTINALTQTSHSDGTALSAYQGYVLNAAIGGKAPTSHATNGSTYGYGTTTNAGHLRVGEGITVSSGTISNSKLGSLVTISGSTTLALSTHANKTIEVNSLSTITIPPNSSVAFPIGTEIDFIRITSSDVTFAPGSGVTLYSESSKRKINTQYQAATLKKIATDIWVLIGALK